MGTVITVNLIELEKLAWKIHSMAHALSEPEKRKLLRSIGKEVEEQTLDRFDDERDPEGTKWRKLTDTYAKRKGKKSHGGILVREGYMRDSIESQVQGSSILIGSTMEYADHHQSARTEKRRRPFLGVSSDNIDGLQDIIDTFMEKHSL